MGMPPTGSTNGHVIQDEGGPLAQKSALSFNGSGITASNDLTFDRTNVLVDAATPSFEGTVSTGIQHFGGRKHFDTGATVYATSAGSTVALVVQSTGGSVGAHIQDWWSSGVTAACIHRHATESAVGYSRRG